MVELFKVIISRDARKVLRKIFGYYKENASEATAKKIKEGLLDKAQSLNRYPERGTLLPGKKEEKHPRRYTKAWSYKVVYRVFQKKKQVRVVDFIHDKEDPEKWKK